MPDPVTSQDDHIAPAAYDWSALPEGMKGAFGVAGVVMAASFLGFGALVRSLDIGLSIGLLTTVSIWALPGQVVLLSMMAHGAGLLATALAVTLTAIRLLPMVVLVLARVRLTKAPRWPEFLLAHFTAVTIWVIANQSLATLALERRLPWLMGLGTTLMIAMLAASSLGYLLAESLPEMLAAGLVFLTPSFFFISLFAGARYRFDYAAAVFGAAVSPVAVMLVPEFDLLVSGVAGGTAAFLLFPPRGRRGL